jgi:PAB-dependent poly(A)-specific ribonuclease subunit 3
VGSYHTLYPLEDVTAETTSQALGVSSQVAKAISSVDGQAYVLRRIDGRQVIPTAELLSSAEAAVARWEPVANHPNLVGLRDAFVSADWDGSPSLFFAHDYHPGALYFGMCMCALLEPWLRGLLCARQSEARRGCCIASVLCGGRLPAPTASLPYNSAGSFNLEQAHIMPTQTPQVGGH